MWSRLAFVIAIVVAASPALAGGRKTTRLAHRPGPASPVRSASTAASVERTAPPPAPASRSRAPGLTLAADTMSVAITTEASVSAGSQLEVVSVAPDLAVGITSDFTMAVIHSSSALTGFRGSAGAGICITDACRARYADVGLEGRYNLARGDFAAALDVGIIASQLEPVLTDLKLGFKIKVGRGRLYAMTTPNVWLALDDRDDPMIVHEHQLWVPFSVWVKASVLSFGVGTGVKGPLDHFGTRWSIPLGGAVQVTVNKHLTLGTSLVFGKFVGGDNVMGTGTDGRAAQLWLAITSG